MSNLPTVKGLTAEEARELTTRINASAGELWQLLRESYERRAWQSLGYDSWQAYSQAEFSMSYQHSYRLLDQGRVIAALSEAAGVSPLGESGPVTEREAREIKPHIAAVTETVRAKVAAGVPPVEAIHTAVQEKRAEQKQERIAIVPVPKPSQRAQLGHDEPPADDTAVLVSEARQKFRASLIGRVVSINEHTAAMTAADDDELRALPMVPATLHSLQHSVRTLQRVVDLHSKGGLRVVV